MKNILVCGSTGFIGRNIAEYLSRQSDCAVYGVYLNTEPYPHEGIRFVRADLTRREDVNRVIKGMDVVIQAAASTSGSKDIINRPYHHVTDNAVMNSLLLRFAYENNIQHFVFFSCSVMYQPSETPHKEIDFNAADTMFPNYFGVGWTKVYIEKMCEFYSRISDTKFSVIRHSNIYGPYDKYDPEKSHVFGATVAKIMTAPDNGEITVWGEGKEKRDLLHVDDLTVAVDMCIMNQRGKYELINIGSGKAVAVSDLVKKIVSASGKKLKIVYDLSKPTIPTTLSLDCEKAKTILGWTPKISIEAGIKMTLDWYKKSIHRKEGAF